MRSRIQFESGGFSGAVPALGSLMSRGLERQGVRLAILRGERDENRLTNLVFFSRHQDRGGMAIGKDEPQLASEWRRIHDEIVRPLLAETSGHATAPAAAPAPAPHNGGVSKCIRSGCITVGNCKLCERRIPWSRPKDLAPVPRELTHGGRAQQLDREALKAYQKLYAAAAKELRLGETLKLASGYRDYDTDARVWRNSLLAVFRMLGCAPSSLPCLAEAMDATDPALKSSIGTLACNAWEVRFRAELKKRGCTVACDAGKVGWLANKYKMSSADPIAVAIRHKRHTLAPATSSPHGTGRALDIYMGGPIAASDAENQRKHPTYRWMACNAARFGFYPYNVEPWHWEYNPAS